MFYLIDAVIGNLWGFYSKLFFFFFDRCSYRQPLGVLKLSVLYLIDAVIGNLWGFIVKCALFDRCSYRQPLGVLKLSVLYLIDAV